MGALTLVLALWWHGVDAGLSAADRTRIAAFLHARDIPLPGPGFDAQLRYIAEAQAAVLEAVPGNVGIPLDQPREPVDVLGRRSGLCYDRSRLLEKIYRFAGLEARHVAVYGLAPELSAIEVLLTPGAPSHAVTEVRTERGWLLVDSNSAWLALGADGWPRDLRALEELGSPHAMAWQPQAGAIDAIFQGPFLAIHGLYSRHGRFYPPFTPVPDINYREFAANFR